MKNYIIRYIAQQVGEKGVAMLPAHMAGGICADNCIGMQLFALDFDDTEARFEDIREIGSV